MWEDNPQIPHKEENMKRKKYLETRKLIEKNKFYSLEEAVELLKKTKTANFDETVDLVINLNVDAKKSDQQLRGAVVLPHGIGKVKKLLVIAKGEAAKEAKENGADFVGDMDIIEKIEKENWFDFDVMIATPDMMPALGKIGKVLGPKGLMPNPKTGTVTNDVAKAVADVKKGRIEYRTDKYGNIHIAVGKISFTEAKLQENIKYFVNMIIKEKPATIKGKFLKAVTISATMGPSIKIDKNSFDI